MPDTVTSQVKARVLPPEEWERLRAYGPFAQAGGVLPDPAHAIVVVVEDETGEIQGCWQARDIIILEALHLSEDWRNSPMASRRLFFGMMEEFAAREVTQAITLVQAPYIETLARKAGFTPLPGSVFLLDRGGK